MIPINNSWKPFIDEETSKDYYLNLRTFLKTEYNNQTIFPPADKIFTAFNKTELSEVKIVILGQDPYHGEGQAMGMSFSVNKDCRIPPSLKNIYKEIESDLDVVAPRTGDLGFWAEQGVFLLNAVLTVRQGVANSHKGKGWERLTDAAIAKINKQDRPIVYMLWGASARSKKSMIANPRHLVLEAKHPSPMSTKPGDTAPDAFFGCKHFSKANKFLQDNGVTPIYWN
jgi:uracil-DNA glycosylase